MAEKQNENTETEATEAVTPAVDDGEAAAAVGTPPDASAEEDAAPVNAEGPPSDEEEAAAAAPAAQETEEPPADEPAPAPQAEAPAAKTAPAPKPKQRAPRPKKAPKPKPKRVRATTGERKPLVRLPKPEHERGRRQERRGVVVSAAMDKTIVVKVDTVKVHPRYKKVIRRSTKFHAHDEANAAKPGDVVRIVETRPLSKLKNWRLAEVVQEAR
jgi:small subunit ribosomal protein S17